MMKTLLRSLCAAALLLGSSVARAEDPPADGDSPHTVRVPWRKKPAQGTPDLPPLPKAPEPATKVVDEKAAAEKAAADKAAAEAWAAQALAEEERAAAAEKAKKQKREEADRAAAAAMPAAPTAVASTPEPAAPAMPQPVAHPIDNPAFVTTSAAPAPAPFNAAQAAWHSALLPGWGQIKTDRPYRGYAFAGAAGISLISAVVLTARASQANNIYQSAPPTVRLEAYNQARSYANARNALWATTAIIWGLNVAEAYFLYGTRDR